MRAFPTVVILAALAAACGIPEAKYKAAVSEAERNMKDAGDQRQRADAAEARARDAEKKSTELEGRLSDVEAKSAAAAAEAEAQRQRAETLQAKSKEYETLASSLDKEIKAGQIKLSELQGKVTVRMGEKVLFPSGSATISPEGKATLKKISEAFATVKDRMIRVEGHTDNVPIHSSRFPSNWELSSARAIAVVRLLQEQGMDPKLLGAAGYGEFQPIAPNDTFDGRAENRRIEISLAAPL
jgi:chemotaxis protein MotB